MSCAHVNAVVSFDDRTSGRKFSSISADELFSRGCNSDKTENLQLETCHLKLKRLLKQQNLKQFCCMDSGLSSFVLSSMF
jgi:hypothetical protein